MRVRLLTLAFSPSLGAFDERPLLEFARDRDVLTIREHFFEAHGLSYMACLITYRDLERATAEAPRTAAAATQALERLNPHDRMRFAALRQWRNARARREGVPPYVLLTNREIVAILTATPTTPTALLGIEGIGPAKVEKYGADILETLKGVPAAVEGDHSGGNA